MDLNYPIFKSNFSLLKGISALRISSFFVFACLLSFSQPSFSQEISGTQVDIDRFAMEIQTVDESTTLISTIVSFTVIHDQISNTLTINFPKAQEVIVNRSKARITDSKGNVIWKGNPEKKITSENSLNFKFGKDQLTREGAQPYTIEWETNILVSSPTGYYVWPTCLSGNINSIKYLGLRVFADNEFREKIETNLEVSSRLMDQSSGLSGVVWELSNYRNKKAWQYTKPIENPYVKISF